VPPAKPPSGSPSPASPAPVARVRPAGSPGFGSIAALAFVFIMVPGMGVYVGLRAVGLAIGPAALLGLLAMVVCLGFYPSLLLRLGWVPPRRRRPPAGRPNRPAEPGSEA
jgi:hypothetical protein